MVSILIPVYNYAIADLVRAIYVQAKKTEIPFEIICLDDASTHQKTVNENEEIGEHEFFSLLSNASNLGRTKTRQLLAEKAKYDWILFLDADVLPKSDDFIFKYFNTNYTEFDCVCGVISYDEKSKNEATILRWTVGKKREEKSAKKRNKNAYNYLLSGNMLIKKEIFLALNYPENENLYGMDVYFGYQLYSHHYKINHIDNAVIHLGLENNISYFNKTLEAVKTRKHYLSDQPKIGSVNSLMRQYKLLKKFYLIGVMKLFFRISEPILKFFIFSKNPNLFCYDLYRLGYICSIKP